MRSDGSRKFGMNVTVYKITRSISIDQAPEAFETAMAAIFGIVNMARRRMGDDDINATMPPDSGG